MATGTVSVSFAVVGRDMRAIMGLERWTHHNPEPESRLREVLSIPGIHCYVAVAEDGTICGFAILQYTPRRVCVLHLCGYSIAALRALNAKAKAQAAAHKKRLRYHDLYL